MFPNDHLYFSTEKNAPSPYIQFFIQICIIFPTILSAAIYIVGYLRIQVLLSALSIVAAPAEIYSIPAIMVSGGAFLIVMFLYAIILIPFFLILIGTELFLKKELLKRNSKMKFFRILFGIAVATILVRILWMQNGPIFSMLIFLRSTNIAERLFNPFSNECKRLMIFSSIVLCVIFFVTSFPVKKIIRKSIILFLIFIWFIGFLFIDLHEIRRPPMAFRPQLLAQCPGIGGIIMTTYPISAGSVVTKHDGQNIFHTYGLLLSIRNNNYYFAPKEAQSDIIQAGSNERSLCIVPQKHVFQFHQNRYGYAFGKEGLYVHE